MKVCIIGGCGHVGLPLALALVDKGHSVDILDIDEDAMKGIQAGKMPFIERNGDFYLKKALKSNRFRLFTDPSCLVDVEVVILITGTPVDEFFNPRYDLVFKVLEPCIPYFQKGQTLILRSTLYPGMSQRIHRFFETRGMDIHIAFCPERVAEGQAIKEIFNLPQIVSAFDNEGLETSARLFGSLTEYIIRLSPLEAELVKLFSNVYRYIHFAIPNQFYMIARKHDVDYEKLHHALTFHYPRTSHLPTPGLTAGPCLLKDTMQLSVFLENHFMLGQAALQINEGMPNFIVRLLNEKFDLSQLTVGLLGVAFKADTDDTRSSLVFKLRKLLALECNEVLVTDPHIQNPAFFEVDEVVRKSDILVLGVPHTDYKELDLRRKPILDIWQFFSKEDVQKI